MVPTWRSRPCLRLGLAAHLGLWLGLPTVGCAKSLLCGRYDEPGPARGDRSPLVDRGEVVGMVVRSRARVKPLYVSPGHLCDLEAVVTYEGTHDINTLIVGREITGLSAIS